MYRQTSRRTRHPEQRPRLEHLPQRWAQAPAAQWVCELASTWSILSEHALDRLEADGWRRLGVGAVQQESAGFRNLATPLARCWAAIDDRDRWGQTFVDVAARSEHWRNRLAQQLLGAIGNSRFDVYLVCRRRRRPTQLRRLVDGQVFTLASRLDRGAYPDGAYVIARVVSFEDLHVSLASAVVDAATVRRLAGARTMPEQSMSHTWFRAALERFTAMADAGRGDFVEPAFADISPASLRRLRRAFGALTRSLARQTSIPSCMTAAGANVHVIRAGRRLGISVQLDDRFELVECASTTCATVDTETSFQSGGAAHTVIQVQRDEPGRALTSTEVDAIAAALARAVLSLDPPNRRAVA